MKVTIDASAATAAYSKAFQHLKSLPGFDHRETLRAEAGSILKQWAGKTKVATEQSMRLRVRSRALRSVGLVNMQAGNDVTINSGIRGEEGRVWFKTRREKYQLAAVISIETGQVAFQNLHFRPDDWSKIVSSINAYRAEYPKQRAAAVASAGLARQSVIQIADDLGIDLNEVEGGGISAAGIAKARAAIASNGQSYKNGSGNQGGNEVKFYVELICNLPYGIKIGMDSTLAFVLQNRAKYIEKSYQKGAFDSMSRATRAFPNIFRDNLAA